MPTPGRRRARPVGGVKIGVLDGDFKYRDRQASGDLPTGLTTLDHCGSDGFENNFDGGHGHGGGGGRLRWRRRAVVPGLRGTLDQTADAVDDLISKGVKIINHSRGIFNSSRADGIYNSSDPAFLPESLVTKAYNAGILWVNCRQ